MAFSWFFRGFSVALFCLEKQCSGLFRYFFVVFSWLFHGPRFGQILRVLALELSSEQLKGLPEGEPRAWKGNRWPVSLDGPNRQSPIALVFSECGQLSQAIPQVDVERILRQRTPIARFESQCNERRVYEDLILCF